MVTYLFLVVLIGVFIGFFFKIIFAQFIRWKENLGVGEFGRSVEIFAHQAIAWRIINYARLGSFCCQDLSGVNLFRLTINPLRIRA